jgi:hypothetical protein
MKHVVFVAPFLAPNTQRFVAAATAFGRVSLVTADSPERLPPALRQRIVSVGKLDGFDAGAVVRATEQIAARVGPVDRMLSMLEQMQVTVARARQHLGLPGLHTEAALNFRDKARMKTKLRAAGLPCAKHRLVESVMDGVDFARQMGGRVVIKPVAGAGAKSTFRANNADEAAHLLLGLKPSRGNPVLLEEFIVGKERSFEVVSIDGQPVWHSLTHYSPPPLDVLRNPWIQWCVHLPKEVEHPRYDDAREAGFAALRVLGMGTGLSHMEWFRRADGTVAISEIAARPPGAQIMGLMSHTTDTDLHKGWARLMIDGVFEPPTRQWSAGVAFFRGQGSGRVRAVHGLDEAHKAVGHLVVETNLPRPGQPKADTYEGEGWAIVKARQTEAVAKALGTLISTVQVELG